MAIFLFYSEEAGVPRADEEKVEEVREIVMGYTI